MTNPFNQSLDWAFQGKRVRVSSTDGKIYTGWLDRMHHQKSSVVLFDAKRVDEHADYDFNEIGATYVRTVKDIEVLTPQKVVRNQKLEYLQPHPDHDGDFEPSDAIIRRCYRNRFAGSFPVTSEEGVIINGHKRIEAAKIAGMTRHPCEIVFVDDETRDELFHLAHRGQEDDEDE